MNTKKSVVMIILFLLISFRTTPQSLDLRRNTFHLPSAMKTGEVVHTIGLATAGLPEDVIETVDAFRAPLLAYRAKVGLPFNLSTTGGIESNIITWHFSAGLNWSHEFGELGVSAGADVAFWFGWLDQEGFDTRVNGWQLYPNISIGYTFPRFSVTVRSELMIPFKQSTRIGDIVTSERSRRVEGWSVGIYIEQPLWKDNYAVIGFKSNFTKFYYPMWAGFSTFDRFFYIPEFIIGLNL